MLMNSLRQDVAVMIASLRNLMSSWRIAVSNGHYLGIAIALGLYGRVRMSVRECLSCAGLTRVLC